MALGFSLLATHSSTSNVVTYTDAETTQPAANSALLCFIFHRGAGGVTPTITAYGATWTHLSGAQQSGGSGVSAWTLTCYEAYAGGSPSSSTAAVGVSGGGSGCRFDIIEITGADGTDFTVQAVGNNGTGTSGSVTLASFGDATNNGAVAAFGLQENEAMTEDATATWTERSDSGFNTPNSRMATETRTGEDTTVTYSWTSNVGWAGIAVEVKVASSNVLDEYAFATETDAAMPFLAATNQTVEFGFASETDAAQPFSADTQIVDDYGFASETDEAMPFSAEIQIVDNYGFASETDEAMPFEATAAGQEVEFDASTDLGTATTGALTGTHTPVDDPSGVIVKIVHGTETTDLITGVTYGGVAMDRVGFAIDNAGEPGRAYLYFLGSGIPTGAQTVTVSHTGTATVKWANVESYTASEDTTVVATWRNDNMGLVADLYSASIYTQQTALRTGVVYTGHANVSDVTLLSGMTAVNSVDFTNFIGRADRETTASSGAFEYGYTSGTTDDFAAFTVALAGVSTVPSTPLGLTSTHVFTWTTLTDPTFGIFDENAAGAIMFVGMYGTPASTDFFTSATYGATSFTEYAQATDTAGEAGHSWGLYVPNVSGSDTVSMVATSVTNPQVAVVFCTASGLNLIDFGEDNENQANPTDDLDSGAEDAIRFGFIFSGLATAASLTPSNLPDTILTVDGVNAVCTRLDADLTPTAGNITVGWTSVSDDVAAVYGAFSEGDILANYGFASETDTAMPFLAASDQTVTYGFADETDAAMPFLAATQQTAEFAFATETDEAMPFEAVVGDTPVEDFYGFAEETDTAMPFTAVAEEGDDSPDEGSPTSPEDSPVDSPIIDSPDEDSPDESPFDSPVVPEGTCIPFFMARRGMC